MTAITKGTVLKTRPLFNKNTAQYLKVFDDDYKRIDYRGFVLSANGGETFGTLEQNRKTSIGRKFLYVKLAAPITVAGKTYSYVNIYPDAVYPFYPTLIDYWVKTAGNPLNVRAKASTTGQSLKKIANHAFAGRSDGTESNGFLQLTLEDGTTKGWASKAFLTATKPAKGPDAPARKPDQPQKPPSTGTGTDVVPKPDEPKLPGKIEIFLENAVGTQNVKWVLYAAIGLAVVAVGIVIWKVTGKKPKKN